MLQAKRKCHSTKPCSRCCKKGTDCVDIDGTVYPVSSNQSPSPIRVKLKICTDEFYNGGGGAQSRLTSDQTGSRISEEESPRSNDHWISSVPTPIVHTEPGLTLHNFCDSRPPSQAAFTHGSHYYGPQNSPSNHLANIPSASNGYPPISQHATCLQNEETLPSTVMLITAWDETYVLWYNHLAAPIFEPFLHLNSARQYSMVTCASYSPLGCKRDSQFDQFFNTLHQYCLQFGKRGKRCVAIGNRFFDEYFELQAQSVWCCRYVERQTWEDSTVLYDDHGGIVLNLEATCTVRSVSHELAFQFAMRIFSSMQLYRMKLEHDRYVTALGMQLETQISPHTLLNPMPHPYGQRQCASQGSLNSPPSLSSTSMPLQTVHYAKMPEFTSAQSSTFVTSMYQQKKILPLQEFNHDSVSLSFGNE